MALLEREAQLGQLRAALASSAAGTGRTLLVCGEAGIGKTTLVDRFTRDVAGEARVLWGACEALFAPRPLGPIHDIVHALGGPLRVQLQAGARGSDLFHGLLDELRNHPRPTVLVVEDVHWADDATLDFIRFVARRIGRLHALLVLTFRDDEVGADHPLTAVLGELPAAARQRLTLPALSRATVEAMARESGRDPRDVYRVTGGNPFFVTELLLDGEASIATSVREAVLARARRLSEPARRVIEQLSVIPERVDFDLLRAIHDDAIDGIGDGVAIGLLSVDGTRIGFRHELARLAFESALPALRRVAMHRRVLSALEGIEPTPGTLTRRAHHAIAAGDAQAMIRHVPEAAGIATRGAAHREAMALLNALLPHATTMDVRVRARFFEQRSRACFLFDQGAEALRMSEAAYHLFDALGDDYAKGCNLVRRAELGWVLRLAKPEEECRNAIEMVRLLERFPGDAALTQAYAASSIILATEDRTRAADHQGRALARAGGVTNPIARAEVVAWVSTSELMLCGSPSRATVDRLWAEAHAGGHGPTILMAWFKRAQYHWRTRELDALEQCVADGMQFARDRDLDRYTRTAILERYRADALMARGRWDEAIAAYEALAAGATLPWWMQITFCHANVALMRIRRGESPDLARLQRAVELDREGMIHVDSERHPLHRARLEIGWLLHDDAMATDAATIVSLIAGRWAHPWSSGEAWSWNKLIGRDDAPWKSAFPDPYARLASDDPRGAAADWQERGYPYEAALALALGDADAQRDAIRLCESLGARGTAERLRVRLREQGVSGIPRGPQERHRGHPAGLTEREQEMLALLAQGLANASIAARVHRSVRTVEHHVAALIDKLGVRNRHEAVAAARSRGLLDD